MDELNGTVHRLQLLQVHVLIVIRVIGHTSFCLTFPSCKWGKFMSIFCCKNKCTKVYIFSSSCTTSCLCLFHISHFVNDNLFCDDLFSQPNPFHFKNYNFKRHSMTDLQQELHSFVHVCRAKFILQE